MQKFYHTKRIRLKLDSYLINLVRHILDRLGPTLIEVLEGLVLRDFPKPIALN